MRKCALLAAPPVLTLVVWRRYATHLLSTTRLSGLAHELSPLEVLPNSVATSLETLGFLEPPPCDSDECPVHGPDNRAAAREAREIAENGGGQEVVLQRNGDVVFWDLVALDGHGNDLPGQGQDGGLRRRVVPGLANEIRRVSVESPYGAETDENGYAADGSWTGQPTPGGGAGGASGFFPFSRRMSHVEGERKSALWRLIGVCARIVMFLTWRAYRLVRHVTRKVLAVTIGWKRDEWEMEQRWVAFERMRQRGEQNPAAGPIRPDRIVRDLSPGMTLVDVNNGDAYVVPKEDEEEDDAEWLPEYGDEADDSEGDDDVASDDDDGSDAYDGAEPSSPSIDGDELQNPLVLYSDLSRPQPVRSQSGSLADGTPSPEEFAPYLLAHHLSSSKTGPLTRRRYRGLVPSGSAVDGDSALSTAIEHRRGEVLQAAQAHAKGGDVAQWMEDEREKWREGRSRFCVVCTVEERTVVLWPCRACRALTD